MFVAAILALTLALQMPAPENVLVTITVARDEHYTRPHVIEISPAGTAGLSGRSSCTDLKPLCRFRRRQAMARSPGSS